MQHDNQELISLALSAAQAAYAPYSKFKVGAALLLENGEIITGCNVENASYGLCLCAERNALSSYVAQGKKSSITKIVIVSPNTDKCYPCGACRQWISELAPEAIIVLQDKENSIEYSIKELLPHSFEL